MSKGSRPRPYSVSQEQFGNNYDAIFRKKNIDHESDAINAYNDERLVSKFDKEQMMTPSVEQMKQGTCGCGRSPTGDCIGWHALTEEQFQAKLAEHIAEKTDE
jgi:hypothetical protein